VTGTSPRRYYTDATPIVHVRTRLTHRLLGAAAVSVVSLFVPAGFTAIGYGDMPGLWGAPVAFWALTVWFAVDRAVRVARLRKTFEPTVALTVSDTLVRTADDAFGWDEVTSLRLGHDGTVTAALTGRTAIIQLADSMSSEQTRDAITDLMRTATGRGVPTVAAPPLNTLARLP